MTVAGIAVALTGLALIGFLSWFFFGSRQVRTAHESEKDEKAKPVR